VNGDHCLLFTVYCLLFTVHCLLFTVHCSLFTAHRLLFTVHCLLLTVYCSLFTVYCSPFTVHCSLFTAHRLLFTVHCLLLIVYCFCNKRSKDVHSSLFGWRNRMGRVGPGQGDRTKRGYLAGSSGQPHACGKDPGRGAGRAALELPIYATAQEALERQACDVFFDYTKPDVAKDNCLRALEHGAYVVIGTSGLTEADYAELAQAAKEKGRGVLAVGISPSRWSCCRSSPRWQPGISRTGRSSITPTMTRWTRPAGRRASYRRAWRKIRPSELTVPWKRPGPGRGAGARLNGSRCIPSGFPATTSRWKSCLACPGRRSRCATIRAAAPKPYVGGGLLAIRKVSSFVGLRRGLDSVLDLGIAAV